MVVGVKQDRPNQSKATKNVIDEVTPETIMSKTTVVMTHIYNRNDMICRLKKILKIMVQK